MAEPDELEVAFPRAGGFVSNFIGGCWLLGHSWVYVDGHGRLGCYWCGKLN